jgi:hypothetical protein
MLYLKCACGRVAEYPSPVEARRAGWTWAGARQLHHVTCRACRVASVQHSQHTSRHIAETLVRLCCLD